MRTSIDEFLARERISDLLRSARSPIARAMDAERAANRLERRPPGDLPLGKPITWVRVYR